MKLKLGPTAPKLHEQLGILPETCKQEQTLLDFVTRMNTRGLMSASLTRQQHQEIIDMLKRKGLFKKR